MSCRLRFRPSERLPAGKASGSTFWPNEGFPSGEAPCSVLALMRDDLQERHRFCSRPNDELAVRKAPGFILCLLILRNRPDSVLGLMRNWFQPQPRLHSRPSEDLTVAKAPGSILGLVPDCLQERPQLHFWMTAGKAHALFWAW